MAEDRLKATEIDANVDEKDVVPRTPRSIRFSGSEWAKVERAAKDHGITAAVFVRNSALATAKGESGADSVTLAPEITELIKHIYRSAYILSTLKRDEMLREGRKEEMDEIITAARQAQATLLLPK